MKSSILIAFILSSLFTFANAPNWGKTGHRATAEIASGYLTPQTKQKISELLDGKSIALVSTFGDDIKSDSKYDSYRKWHYIDFPKGKTYEDIKAKLDQNIISAIKTCIKELKNESTELSEKRFYLKMLIHLIGDLHQPLHVGHARDKGGNLILVTWFGEMSNLHKVWDSEMIDSYKMSYSELAGNQQKLSKEQVEAIQEGSVIDWMKDTRKITDKIYGFSETGDHLKYKYMYKWMPVVREQLQKGGIRLAKVLNDIFD